MLFCFAWTVQAGDQSAAYARDLGASNTVLFVIQPFFWYNITSICYGNILVIILIAGNQSAA